MREEIGPLDSGAVLLCLGIHKTNPELKISRIVWRTLISSLKRCLLSSWCTCVLTMAFVIAK